MPHYFCTIADFNLNTIAHANEMVPSASIQEPLSRKGLPIQLHVIHDLGGGSATWLRDFCAADTGRSNLVLRSFTQSDAMGCGIALYANVSDEVPVKMWHFANQIQATVVTHAEYLCALNEIIVKYRVDALLVSSVIGHSLDVLNTDLPTVVVNHDYFPYCPAINICFGNVCKQCDETRIGRCYRDNPKFNPFVTFLPPERVAVREQFLALVARQNVTMAVPSRSVEENLVRLDERFRRASFVTIPHGYGRELKKIDVPAPLLNDRFRILVLGQLSVSKGVELLRESLDALTEFADVYLIGCRELGEFFKFRVGVHVFENYQIDDLPIHVANVNPHVGLLMSVVPETFSYALTELMMLGVPVAATRVGSFPERIRHQQDGYLYDPDAASLLTVMKSIDKDRHSLEKIRQNLLGWKRRTAEAMVAEYHLAMPITTAHAGSMGTTMHTGKRPENSTQDEIRLTQSLTISSMWKEIKSLSLQLSMINQARQDLTSQVQALSNQRTELTNQHQELSNRLDQERRAAQQALQVVGKQVEDLTSEVTAQHVALLESSTQMKLLNKRFDEVISSKSWKLTRPVRALGHFLRRLKIIARSITQLLSEPASLPANVAHLARVWRAGGSPALKSALVDIQRRNTPSDVWEKYRLTFIEEVKPQIVRRIGEFTKTPTISIIVPTYNTPETMLREMLESVKAQIYPHWELCIADDSSGQRHVKRILQEYAANEPRIKLHLGTRNHGVSYASNRALEMVTGEFVVLLDHDDLLEEQALFRVAESILQDQPDVVYSDEVLVAPDLAGVLQLAYRPAFSPEFLRSHPYIVHMIGFRTQVLRDIGGFNESLKISQDYDLILRATENANCIVHIPEILYKWRILPSSAGEQKKHEVMATSRALLQKHLDRCGERGTVADGAGFNLFDTRYPLLADLKVAIIIPTKNHGDMLRRCIDSIGNTTSGIGYDIVVIDHESDDVDTLTYLSSISPAIRVLHYKGKFNFSAINNWAVSRLDSTYSHYLFCNNDIEAISPDWLEHMLELGQRRAIGIVGARLMYPDRKTIQHAGVCVGLYGAAEHYGKFLRTSEDPIPPGFLEVLRSNHEVAAVTAACLLIRKDAFDKIGGFDEALAVGFGDVDLCLRVREQGYAVLYCAHAELLHHESYTRGKSVVDPHPEDSALFRTKWQKMLNAGDPYFNPGLSLNSTSWHNAHPLTCRFDIRRRVFTRNSVTGMQKIMV